MEASLPNEMRVALLLLKDFSATHTVTSIAKELGMTRSGAWKVLKRLEREKYIIMRTTGKETSMIVPKLNFKNGLLDKYLDLALSMEASVHERWAFNFADVSTYANFLILYGSVLNSYSEAEDIDIVGVVHGTKGFKPLHASLDKLQKSEPKRIHAINFTEAELKDELVKPNKAFVEAVKKGIVLFGQEEFIRFMRKLRGVFG